MKKFFTHILPLLLCAILLLTSCGGQSSAGTEPAGDSPVGDGSGEGGQNTGDTDTSNGASAPEITIATPVATGVCIIGGLCSNACEAVEITGDGVESTRIAPDFMTDSGYFMGQVKVNKTGKITAREVFADGTYSLSAEATASYTKMENLLTSDDYRPYFAKNSRIHYYSAILAYTLSDAVSNWIRERAEQNIGNNVAALKEANPDAEIIYLVVPTSAAVYPETLPEEFEKASGATVYDVFREMATEAGAKVIYPLDAFLDHKDDGLGYKIFNNTDSHWSAYGAYWGVAEMMNYISEKYPAAAPRTVDEMGFYTKELWGGDSLFSFSKGFEIYDNTGHTGETAVTKISELTTIYSREMPTSTIHAAYRGDMSTYLDDGLTSAPTVFTNPNGEGLPTALVIRDSFSCTAYDMVNDRFAEVNWQPAFTYDFPAEDIERDKPDYLIYLVSERNLLKVMLENDNISLTQLAK